MLKYSIELKEAIYKDYLQGDSIDYLISKYNLREEILINIINREKLRNLYVSNYCRKLETVLFDCERLIINGCSKEEIYDYFCTIKPQLQLDKKYIFYHVLKIKDRLNGFQKC